MMDVDESDHENIRRGMISCVSSTTTVTSNVKLCPADNYQLVRQIDKQFCIEKDLQIAKFGIRLALGDYTVAVRKLDDYRSRLDDLKSSKLRRSGKRQVDHEIKLLRKHVSINMITCPKCSNLILKRLFSSHLETCQNKYREVCESKSYCLMEPQPPRNVRIGKVGHNFIELYWDDPVLNGGSNIFDFDISLREKIYREVGKRKIIADNIELVLISISCWCLDHPIPVNYFRVTDLKANTEYYAFRIRCRNSVGLSKFSSPLENLVTTLGPKHPTSPLFFKVSAISSSSISFTWSPSFDDGGVPITFYILTYTSLLPNDSMVIHTKYFCKVKEVTEVKRVDSHCTSLTLDNLPGSTSLKDIKLEAQNEAGLKSPPTYAPNQQTLEPTRKYLLEKEIERVLQLPDDTEFIDSDIFQGIMQRKARKEYLSELENELLIASSISLDVMTMKSAKVESGNVLLNESHSVTKQTEARNETKTYQFKYRINALERAIEKISCKQRELATSFETLSIEIQKHQSRDYQLQSELERILSLDGTSTSSNILHLNCHQNFKIDALSKALRHEIAACRSKINSSKVKFLEKRKEYRYLGNLFLFKLEQLRERKAAYFYFCRKRKNYVRSRPALNELMKSVFSNWLNLVSRRSQIQAGIEHMNSLFTLHSISRIFLKWKHILSIIKAPNELVDKMSLGDVLLADTEDKSNENSRYAMQIFHDISKLKTDLVQSRIANFTEDRQIEPSQCNSYEQQLVEYFNASFLLLGDSYFRLNRFEDAKKSYILQLNKVEGDFRVSEKSIHIRALLYGRLGYAAVGENKLDEGIFYFERQLEFGKMLSCASLQALALCGLADSYKNKGYYTEAREHYGKSAILFSGLNETSQELLVSRKIQELSNKLNGSDNTRNKEDEADMLEFKIQATIKSGFNMMNEMTSKLLKLNCKIDKLVKFEYITIDGAKLRFREKMIMKEIEMTNKDLRNGVVNEEKIKLSIEELRSEISRCAAVPPSSKIQSNLVHGSEQIVQQSDLENLLVTNQDKYLTSLSMQSEKNESLKINLANLEYDLITCREQMAVETGVFIRSILANRSFRCIAFNATNIEDNNVLGRSKDGITSIAASEGKNLLVYDINSGLVTHVFPGNHNNCNLTKENSGHSGVVACLYFRGPFLYSGSLDKTIICWDILRNKRVFKALGHNSTVTCIFVCELNMLSGSNDKSIIIWDKSNGIQIKRVTGHQSGVTSLKCSASWMLASDQSGYAYLWKIDQTCPNHTQVILKKQFFDNDTKTTTLYQNICEVISGHADGSICTFWLASGELIHKYRAHKRAISALQADASFIVSCGLDMVIAIAATTSGTVLQSLIGIHEAPILSMCFDSHLIVSVDSSGHMVVWQFQVRIDHSNDSTAIVNRSEKYTVFPEAIPREEVYTFRKHKFKVLQKMSGNSAHHLRARIGKAIRDKNKND